MTPSTARRYPQQFQESFFRRDTLTVARKLLGVELATTIGGIETAGSIVEVEAYGAVPDPASHGFRGRTGRNRVLFSDGGHAYVYLIYGMHCCVNVSTEHEGKGCGVLIRAIEPTVGIKTMRERRGGVHDRLLTNGPGKLCQALAITRALNGESYLTSDHIHLRPGVTIADDDVVQTTRIGITSAVDFPWRFYVNSSFYVSKR